MNNLKKIVMIAATSIVGMYALSTNDVTANSVPNITAGEANKPRMDLVDVSSWNKTLSVTDFQKMKAHGVRGVIVKLTEGNYYVSPVAATQISNARAAGLIVSAYHYAKYRSPQEAYQEADYFANQVQKLGLPTTTVLANDLEDSQTQAGNVTNNALAFRNRLTALGYQRQMLYTAPYYISQTQLDVNLFGNRNIWMASYPYNPTSDNLWHQQYGAWQWNSNTNFPGVTGVFDVSVDYGSQFLEEQATTTNVNDAIQNNEHETQPKPVLPTKPVEKKESTHYQGYIDDGTAWRWSEKGRLFTGFRFYRGAYYWFKNGVRQVNQWESAWGNRYYVGFDGRAVQGLQTINQKQYYFGYNGTFYLRTNQKVTINKQHFLANEQGVLTKVNTKRQGYLDTPQGWRWFENNQLFTGFRFYMGAYYWFEKGVRQENKWKSAWGYRYYVGSDGRAVQGHRKINGHWYYFGNDNTFYLR